MKLDWNQFVGKMINVTLHENYGIVLDQKSDSHVYEIVFKSGILAGAFDDGLLLENKRDGALVRIFVPYTSVKCIEII